MKRPFLEEWPFIFLKSNCEQPDFRGQRPEIMCEWTEIDNKRTDLGKKTYVTVNVNPPKML